MPLRVLTFSDPDGDGVNNQAQIDGAANIPVAVSTGLQVVFDGTNRWTVGST